MIIQQPTHAFTGQKPGTSGLRKKVTEFQQPHYLANFVQAIFNVVERRRKPVLVIGGDGRFFNREAIQIIIKLAIANGYKRLIIGQGGILSTPAASCVIRKYQADGGIILSASHNPAGPEEDFGIKYNGANGGPATAQVTDAIYQQTLSLTEYRYIALSPVDIDAVGTQTVAGVQIDIIDSVADYAELMRSIFDFPAIAQHLQAGRFGMRFDAMHAVTGPYAVQILERELGAPDGTVINATPMSDFGGGHPDPNLKHAKELVRLVNENPSVHFAAASDGDGDRNMILGKGVYVNPCDSLAVLVANAELVPHYSAGINGVARSMPTSPAADRVAQALGIESYETPTGWKFFGNLMDAGRIHLCGEESFGTGSSHVREKDGLWAVLYWLNILAKKQCSVGAVLEAHWQQFGRDYFTRHDYEGIDVDQAEALVTHLKQQLPTLIGQVFDGRIVTLADEFSYIDPVDQSMSAGQGIRIGFDDQSRVVFRLSGTGTSGATLRVYCNTYSQTLIELDPQEALAPILAFADSVAGIRRFTGREAPDVIT